MSEFQQPISRSINAVSQAVDITSPNSGTSVVQVMGTWAGVIKVQGSNDDTTWSDIATIFNNDTFKIVSTIDTNGTFIAPTNGFQSLRLLSSAWTSGTVNFEIYGSDHLSLANSLSILRGATTGTLIGNADDKLKVTTDLNQTAFGELAVNALDPYVSLEPTRGLKTRDVEQFTSGTASFSNIIDNNPGKEFQVSSGTDANGYGLLRSKRTLTYRPGIGALSRFTARFTTPVANSIQKAGMMNMGNELTFGYNGTQFGILRKTGGRSEIRTLTINTASDAATTVTITLNGVAQGVSVTNTSAVNNAFEVVNNFDWTTLGWNAYNIDNTVIFQSNSTGLKNGTYSAISGAGAFVAIFTQTSAGVTEIDNWYYQNDWSETSLNSGNDLFILDPTKGNVYQIQFQYLGYGALNFYIERPGTGDLILVHRVTIANQAITPSLDLPSLKLGIVAANLTNTTNLSVYSACMAGFHENVQDYPFNSNSTVGAVSGINTVLTNVLALKKIATEQANFDSADVLLERVTAASEATKPIFFEIRLNPTFSDNMLWTRTQSDSTIVSYAGGGTVTGGRVIYSVSLSKSSNIDINLNSLGVLLTNNDVISIAARASNGSVDAAASAIWGEK